MMINPEIKQAATRKPVKLLRPVLSISLQKLTIFSSISLKCIGYESVK
jgi:hypothetical protein